MASSSTSWRWGGLAYGNRSRGFQLAVHGIALSAVPLVHLPGDSRGRRRDVGITTHHSPFASSSSQPLATSTTTTLSSVQAALRRPLGSRERDPAPRPVDQRPRRPSPTGESGDHATKRDVTQAHVLIGCEGFLSATDPGLHDECVASILAVHVLAPLSGGARKAWPGFHTTYAWLTSPTRHGYLLMHALRFDNVDEVEAIMRAQLEDLAADGPTEGR